MDDQVSPKKLFTLFDGNAPHIEEETGPQLPKKIETGQLLTEARQRLNLSVGDVAAALYLSEHYITAIENRNFEELPSIAYATGYVRAYANFVHLNADELIETDPDLGLPAIDEEVEAVEQRDITIPKHKPIQFNYSWVATATKALSVVAVLTVLLVAWNFWDEITVWWNERIMEEKILEIEEGTTPPSPTENLQEQIGSHLSGNRYTHQG